MLNRLKKFFGRKKTSTTVAKPVVEPVPTESTTKAPVAKNKSVKKASAPKTTNTTAKKRPGRPKKDPQT